MICQIGTAKYQYFNADMLFNGKTILNNNKKEVIFINSFSSEFSVQLIWSFDLFSQQSLVGRDRVLKLKSSSYFFSQRTLLVHYVIKHASHHSDKSLCKWIFIGTKNFEPSKKVNSGGWVSGV